MSESDQPHNDDDRIDMEKAALHGHQEAKARMLELRSEHEVQRLENITNGFLDFARCVRDAERWERNK